ncbi:MAG: hypothetical protein IJT90_01345 [Bacteroidaceae bacterium]|nr:hypothetical protein [Bacteroidaceae bacterium]
MKKIFTSMLLLIAGVFIMTAQAADYQIWVGGLQVTDANKGNISPASLTYGTVTFDSDKKILHCNNVTISGAASGIVIQEPGITVYFSGILNEFTSSNSNTFQATQSVTLDGPNSGLNTVVLFKNTAESKTYAGMYFNCDGQLNIKNLSITVNSTHYAICGPSGSNAKLNTSCTTIYADSGEGYPAVYRFSNWTMQDYGFLRYQDTYNTTNKRTENRYGNLTNSITLLNGLYVGGLMVRADANSSTTVLITPTGKTKGTISYKDKKLTLDNVNYDNEGTKATFIDNNIDGLTIECKGTNTINGKSVGAPVDLSAHTTFTGNGRLSLTSTGACAIYAVSNVTINMDTFEAQGKTYGFYGQTTSALTLKKYSNNSIYKFAGAEKANVYTGNLVMDGMDIWSKNTYFHDSYIRKTGGEIAVNDDIEKSTWFKSTNQFTYYPLYVAGTLVSDRNKDNILSPYITSGTVSYNSTSKTLTLNGVQLEARDNDGPNGIRMDKLDLTLNFTGADQHWTTYNNVMNLDGNITITGDCKRVYLTSTSQSGISANAGTNVTINTSGYFGAKGAKYGYYGGGANGEALTLHKETSDTWGYVFEGEQGAIYYVVNLNLDNMDYSYNSVAGRAYGCYFDPAKKSVVQNGGAIAKGSVGFQSIKETLPISICGKQLNRVIDGSVDIYVGSPYISSGPKSVAYNPDAKTLTLNNAAIDYTDGSHVIYFLEDAEVTVNVKGNNTVRKGNVSSIVLDNGAKVIFQGDGILDVEGKLFGLFPWGRNSVTAITGDLLLKATGGNWGIGANNAGKRDEALIIGGNAVVSANKISALGSLTLKDGQQVVEPAGAVVKKVDEYGWGVYANESSTDLAQNVVIQPADYTGIKGVRSEELGVRSDTGLYDLSGRRVSSSFRGMRGGLPHGIYILNGKKVIK